MKSNFEIFSRCQLLYTFIEFDPLKIGVNGPIVDAAKGIAEYNYTAFGSADEDYFTARLDHRLFDKDSLFVRYTFDDGRNRSPFTTGVFLLFTHEPIEQIRGNLLDAPIRDA